VLNPMIPLAARGRGVGVTSDSCATKPAAAPAKSQQLYFREESTSNLRILLVRLAVPSGTNECLRRESRQLLAAGAILNYAS
jgi:hypothetical protein